MSPVEDNTNLTLYSLSSSTVTHVKETETKTEEVKGKVTSDFTYRTHSTLLIHPHTNTVGKRQFDHSSVSLD